MPIPQDLRDGNPHTMYCYGLDVTGGDWPSTLNGSPMNFRFQNPVGLLNSVTSNGDAIGWSADPSIPDQPNIVHFYVDGPAGSGTYIGQTIANTPWPGVPYPGNHGYSFSIPAQYRDNQQHTIYAYGIDLSGDEPKHLPGSPKTFNLRPVVESTTFVEVMADQLSVNNNPGGGLRIFPEKMVPAGPVNDTLNVKARISTARAGVRVYFYSYDLDDPSAAGPPIDVDNIAGQDNRSYAKIGDLCPGFPPGCDFDPSAIAFWALTDNNGEAVIPFRLTEAHPGDNYAVIATTNPAEPAQIRVDGTVLYNNSTGRLLLENVNRTRMLTAWRTLHIERDSMGIVEGNLTNISTLNQHEVGDIKETISTVQQELDFSRFQNGRMPVTENDVLTILDNDKNNVSVQKIVPGGPPVTVNPFFIYPLYDDDDFNDDTWPNGFDSDNGEDVVALHDSYNLLQENDDRDCIDGTCNVFATAYIVPNFSWGDQYSTTNVLFKLNINDIAMQVEEQIDLGRNIESGENDNFWVAYVQIGYQHSTVEDEDPENENSTFGATKGQLSTDDVTNESGVPLGSEGSLVYIEVMRDGHRSANPARIKTIPHEIGHQFGLRGDDRIPNINFGLMGYSTGLNFIDRQINVIRWRRKSPGIPRN